MGQALWKFAVKDWKDKQLRKITDRIFDKLQNKTHEDKIPVDGLYANTLLAYNEINKLFFTPHHDPPSTERVHEGVQELKKLSELIQDIDMNKDQYIDRDEFFHFIMSLTSEKFKSVGQILSILLTLVVAPTVAVVTKKSTERVPAIGKYVKKLPVSAYAVLVTLAALIFQKPQQLLK